MLSDSHEANKSGEYSQKTEPPMSREEHIKADKERLKSLDKDISELEEAKAKYPNDRHRVKELQKDIDSKREEMQKVGQRIDRLQTEGKEFQEKYGSSLKK